VDCFADERLCSAAKPRCRRNVYLDVVIRSRRGFAAPTRAFSEAEDRGCLAKGTRAKRACPVFQLEMRSISS
jgi:hypothetical protein